MPDATATRARHALRTLVGTALACAALGAMASPALAASNNTYTVNITPTTAPAGATQFPFTVVIGNDRGSRSAIQSATIQAPVRWKFLSASAGQVSANIIQLTELSLAPGSTLSVTVIANVAPRCDHAFPWFSKAFVGAIGTQRFALNSEGSSRTTTTTGCTLQFSTQPTGTGVNQPISPPVAVEVLNAAGGIIDTPAPITIGLGNNPGGATLSGTLTKDALHGVATFSNLTLNQQGLGYTLTASSAGASGATSSSFNVGQTTSTTCTTSPCTTDLGTPISNLQVSADAAAGTITESVDIGSPLSCAAPANGGYTGFDTNWFQFAETGTVQKTLSYELFGLTSDQIGSVQMCFGAPYDFTTNNGTQAAPGTLPDGTSGFVGLLPGCGAVEPCIQSIVPFSDDNSGLLVTVLVPGTLPNGAPADPWVHG